MKALKVCHDTVSICHTMCRGMVCRRRFEILRLPGVCKNNVLIPVVIFYHNDKAHHSTISPVRNSGKPNVFMTIPIWDQTFEVMPY